MGFWKELETKYPLVKNLDLHYTQAVCADCFEDESLQEFIADSASEDECSFCGRTGEQVAVPLLNLADFMNGRLQRYFARAVECLPYEGREGGYQGEYWSTDEFLLTVVGIELPNDGESNLLEALCDVLGGEPWCQRDPFALNQHEEMFSDWTRFCELVKHQRRYFLDADGRKSASSILRTVGELCDELGLVTELAEGETFYRVRRCRGTRWTRPADLGPPPSSEARQSRMSPAGITMMYVAVGESTALLETADEPDEYAIARFRTCRVSRVLELSALPPPPSPFHPNAAQYHAVRFLQALAADMAKPIKRDEMIHIEYVPTQIATEYFRTFGVGGASLDGIRYRSSRGPSANIVLFAGPSQVVGSEGAAPDAWMALVDSHVVNWP